MNSLINCKRPWPGTPCWPGAFDYPHRRDVDISAAIAEIENIIAQYKRQRTWRSDYEEVE